ERCELPREEAIAFAKAEDEPFKVELIEDLPEGAHISFYRQGEFTDLCAGPHLDYTGRIKANAFKLLTCNAAYWRGDSERESLQRIYGMAFPTKQELDEYIERIEEAKRRDHRKLGKELKLFAFNDEAPGFPFYLPNGVVLRNELVRYWRELHRKWDYVEIMTPQIMRRTLWETSGHWEHYKENMYTTVIEDEEYAIKPMNCPGSILVYETEPRSYRDLPLRYGELGIVHRHEMSGALHGMFRVRCFTQDDAHLFLTKDQIEQEVSAITQLIDEMYGAFGLSYKIVLSTMPEEHIGTREVWEQAENALADAITSIGKSYEINPGDGAFYGPKLDFHVTDSLGRVWQCGTIQLDYQLPERFELEYTDSSGEKLRPVMIHRVVYGSLERFLGVITEHFAGAFPAWLAPVQVKILTVTDRAEDYAQEICKDLAAQGFRVEVDARNEKIGRKIRDARLEKLPYMLVVGDRDVENSTVSPRHRSRGELEAMSLAEFAQMLKEEVESKALD
ncbi:MAG: threonine--tRNA ligase, partial [Clostridiales bacterium]|nr:threonine--tRNA ligase [Clostridiales bacterium]